MTRLCDPPLPVDVELSPEGIPQRLRAAGLAGALAPVAQWLADADWWARPIARHYFKALLSNPKKSGDFSGTPESGQELLVELFHDLHEDAWYLERIYD